MSAIDFLVKLRDHSQAIADAANEYLETLAPREPSKGSAGPAPAWDPTKIQWEKRSGANGEYERSVSDSKSVDFKAMMADLDAHQGKLTREGFFYWRFTDNLSVGRKPVHHS